jgi:hypothetical protein
MHILVKGSGNEDVRVGRACLEAIAVSVEWTSSEETPYSVLLLREELSRAELLFGLIDALRKNDLWLRFWALRALLTLARHTQLPALRGALLNAAEGPRLLADTVKARKKERRENKDCLTIRV